MLPKRSLFLFVLILVLVLTACNATGETEPTAAAAEPTAGARPTPTTELLPTATVAAATLPIADCPEAVEGTYQLLDAAHGLCFLYPDNYDVFESGETGFSLYVKSLLNTEAPLASLTIEPTNGRNLEDVLGQYLPDVDFDLVRLQTVDLGGETGIVLDNLPGQDTNRRVIAIRNNTVYDLMIARIGEDYGVVGELAEALYTLITGSFTFIEVQPDAALVAGPECPEAEEGLVLFTNTEGGFCVLIPEQYAIDDNLTTENNSAETAVYVDSSMNVTAPRLFIRVQDANGRSLDEVTTAIQQEFADFEVMWSFGYMVDGVPANQFEQLPGQDLNRQVVLVHNNHLYTLTFVPDDPEMGDVYTAMQTLYEIVMDSFSFLRQE